MSFAAVSPHPKRFILTLQMSRGSGAYLELRFVLRHPWSCDPIKPQPSPLSAKTLVDFQESLSN